MLKLLFVQLLLIPMHFALDTRSSYIVHGRIVKVSKAPWHVLIKFDDNIHCGGSIISNKFILSAAHCFHNYRGFPINRWRLSFGSDDLDSKNLTFFKMKRYLYHEKFDNPFYANDIALLELEQPIDFKLSSAKPISLIRPTENIMSKDCYTYGFGSTESSWKSKKLKEAKVTVIDGRKCQKLHCVPTKKNEVLEVYRSNICAGNLQGGEDSCQGDSGGGLVYKNINSENFLAGIVSHGEGCGLPDRPTIYTQVTSYFDWISFHTKMKIHDLPVPRTYNYNPKLANLYHHCPY